MSVIDTMTPNQACRAATFKAAAQGLRAYRVAKALNVLRPSFDFRGMTKTAMMVDYAQGCLAHIDGQELRCAIATTCRQ